MSNLTPALECGLRLGVGELGVGCGTTVTQAPEKHVRLPGHGIPPHWTHNPSNVLQTGVLAEQPETGVLFTQYPPIQEIPVHTLLFLHCALAVQCPHTPFGRHVWSGGQSDGVLH